VQERNVKLTKVDNDPAPPVDTACLVYFQPRVPLPGSACKTENQIFDAIRIVTLVKQPFNFFSSFAFQCDMKVS
jgi:hypothetical protein